MSVDVAPGTTSCVAILYANDLQLAAVDPSHDSVMAYLLRMGSDFRDIYLAKSPVGLGAIRFYYDHALKPWEVVSCCIIVIAAGAIIVIFWQRRSRGGRQSRDTLAQKSI
jgi:fructose-1,6-bisphosphatase/inositol monophosphatase family enzyme